VTIFLRNTFAAESRVHHAPIAGRPINVVIRRRPAIHPILESVGKNHLLRGKFWREGEGEKQDKLETNDEAGQREYVKKLHRLESLIKYRANYGIRAGLCQGLLRNERITEIAIW